MRVNPLWVAADLFLAYTWPNESLIGRRGHGRSRRWVRAELSLDRAKLTKNKRSSGASDSSPFSIRQHQCSWMTLIHNCLLYFLLIIPQLADDQRSRDFQARNTEVICCVCLFFFFFNLFLYLKENILSRRENFTIGDVWLTYIVIRNRCTFDPTALPHVPHTILTAELFHPTGFCLISKPCRQNQKKRKSFQMASRTFYSLFISSKTLSLAACWDSGVTALQSLAYTSVPLSICWVINCNPDE